MDLTLEWNGMEWNGIDLEENTEFKLNLSLDFSRKRRNKYQVLTFTMSYFIIIRCMITVVLDRRYCLHTSGGGGNVNLFNLHLSRCHDVYPNPFSISQWRALYTYFSKFCGFFSGEGVLLPPPPLSQIILAIRMLHWLLVL